MIVPVLQKGQDRLDLFVDGDDNEKIVIVPDLQNGQDRLDLLVDDDDKEKIVIVSVLQKGQDRLDLLVDDDDNEKIVIIPVLQNLVSQASSLTTSIVPKLLPPQSIRRNSLILHPPPPKTSFVPPLLPPPSTRRNSLIAHQPPPTFAREPLQSPEGGVIVLIDSPLSSNYTDFFENKIRSVYYPSNHITVFNNISNVCTADPYIGTTKIQRDICQYCFRSHPASFLNTNQKLSRTNNILRLTTRFHYTNACFSVISRLKFHFLSYVFFV